MSRYIALFLKLFTFFVFGFAFGCGEEFIAQPGGSGGTGGLGGGGTGGTAGTGGNTGGTGGTGGLGGGGTGGTGGTGGGGGDPCSGMYLQVASVGSGGNLSSNVGPVTSTTYDVFGTSVGNELNATVTLVNNVSGDFTSPQATSALEAVYLRCQDPAGGPTWTVVCNQPLVGGQAECVSPGCYSASGGVVQMQIQIDPAAGQSGQVRIGINPTPPMHLCGDQSQIPIYTIIQ